MGRLGLESSIHGLRTDQKGPPIYGDGPERSAVNKGVKCQVLIQIWCKSAQICDPFGYRVGDLLCFSLHTGGCRWGWLPYFITINMQKSCPNALHLMRASKRKRKYPTWNSSLCMKSYDMALCYCRHHWVIFQLKKLHHHLMDCLKLNFYDIFHSMRFTVLLNTTWQSTSRNQMSWPHLHHCGCKLNEGHENLACLKLT